MVKKQNIPAKEKIVSVVLLAGLILFMAIVIGPGFSEPSSPNQNVAEQMLPAGWSAVGGWEIYPKGRLYEKINGREPLFDQYGVVRLRYASVSKGTNDFEVYFYDMQTPDGALGIYLANTPSEFDELELGTLADISGGQVRVLKGRTYLEIFSLAEQTPKDFLIDLSSALVETIPTEKEARRTAVELLPKQGRVRGTLILNRENTYGLAKLTDIFSASYQQDNDEFDYLIRTISPSEGRKMMAAVGEEILEFDGKIIQSETNSLVAEFMRKTLILNQTGDFLIGLYGAVPPDQGRRRLDQWIETMKDQLHGSGK